MITTILFDLDGTLLDSNTLQYESFKEALKNIADYDLSKEMNNNLGAITSRDKLKILGIDNNLWENIQYFKDNYFINNIDKVKCLPNTRHLIRKLKKEHYNLGCITNTNKISCNLLLSKANILSHLDYVITREDGVNPKPSPDMIFRSLRYFKCQPGHCLVVEDSEIGIQAAAAAQTYFIKINSPEDLDSNLLSKYLCIT